MAGAPRLNPNPRYGSRPRHCRPQLRRICAQNSRNDSPEQQLKNATAGAYQKMAFIEHQKQSQNGPGESHSRRPACSLERSQVTLAGLRGWILDHVTAFIAVEFSAFHPAGFAGACDALVDLDGEGPFIVDWKTTGKSIHKNNEAQLFNYRHQTGAYSLMLNYRTGIQAVGGAVVVARRFEARLWSV